ncbi:MAG: TIGR01777 family oxidoreductase [Micrococcales bacterium]
MRVLISGASGLVGTEVARQLAERGDQAIRLVRRPARSADEIEWNPATGTLDSGVMETIDAVVNMAGATTGKLPWTKAYKLEIVGSRLDSTRTLVNAINAATKKPKVLVSGSASGYYGDTGNQVLNETDPKGTGFLADLAAQWEAEAKKVDPSVRLVLARTTMVLSRKLGALGRLLPILKLGVGGPLGNGKQWWAWISVQDEAGAILHLIDHATANGPFNLTAPEPATCRQLVDALGKALNRPTLIPVPEFALRLAFGEGADELLLCSQNMSATKLLESGYVFRHPTLKSAAEWVVGKD